MFGDIGNLRVGQVALRTPGRHFREIAALTIRCVNTVKDCLLHVGGMDDECVNIVPAIEPVGVRQIGGMMARRTFQVRAMAFGAMGCEAFLAERNRLLAKSGVGPDRVHARLFQAGETLRAVNALTATTEQQQRCGERNVAPRGTKERDSARLYPV
ncbi:hypothetical protein BH10PSE13_BH10PSE13_10440 [soil metagenome]